MIKPTNKAYATLAYFTQIAVTIPATVVPTPEIKSKNKKKPLLPCILCKNFDHWSKGIKASKVTQLGLVLIPKEITRLTMVSPNKTENVFLKKFINLDVQS